MKKRTIYTRGQLLLCIAAAASFTTYGTGDQLVMLAMAQMAEPEMKIHVTMKDKEYHVKGYTTPGMLTAIVLRNEDTVTHGFSSSLFKQVLTIKEGDAEEIRKKGHVFSYHLDPGKTATIYFEKRSTSERETVQVPFWCDIHSQMKGEFLVVETTGEIGGG